MKYQAYTNKNFEKIPQLQHLDKQIKKDIEIVGHVLPFKVNNFILDHLINWDDAPNDPLFKMTFPQKEMLSSEHYQEIADLLHCGVEVQTINQAADRIRLSLNPHPAGQMHSNTVFLNGEHLPGVQHKYEQTVLYFPSHGQTCPAYCTFCFRWAQFIDRPELRFASQNVEGLIEYIRLNPQITDILITGGDPLVMSANRLAAIINPILNAKLPNLQRIRIGSKILTYWPFRFLTARDSKELVSLFKKVVNSGLHLALMTHFNHPKEYESPFVRDALQRVLETGAQVRNQSPILRHINDNPDVWQRLWDIQVNLGCLPYYMFIPRNTGANHYFNIPLERAWQIFRTAYQQVSGLCRTIRGPIMSTDPGKIQIMGISEVKGEKVFHLRFLQARDPDWVQKPFFARYDQEATWLNDLQPAFGAERFFFE